MTARLNLVMALLAAIFAFGAFNLAPTRAHAEGAGGGGATGGCCTVTPPCNCTPPVTPPSCCSGGPQINIPSVNVNVGATVIVNANASATGFAIAGSNAQSNTMVFGGGGGSFGVTQSSGLIGALNVEGESVRTPYSATRTKIRTVVIQAVCIDDQAIPHPASQVTPDREIADLYEGEVFRCIAGTHMQWTMADYSGKIAFDHGQVIDCSKNEALFKSASGELACKPQRPARDCNERSLLRRYGAGVKIIKIVTVEHYEAFREQTVTTGTASAAGMTIDGGVGGIVY